MKTYLSYKISISIIITVIFIFSVGFYFLLKVEQKQIHEEIRNDAILVSNFVYHDIKQIIKSNESKNQKLQNLVQSFKKYNNLEHIEIFNKNAIIIAHSDIERVGESPQQVHLDFINKVFENGMSIEEEDRAHGRLNRFVPIITGEEEGQEVSGVIEVVMKVGQASLVAKNDIRVISSLFQAIAAGIIEESISMTSQLQKLSEDFSNHAEINYVAVFDSDAVIIAHSDRERVGKGQQQVHIQCTMKAFETGEAVENKSHGTFNRYVPIINGEDGQEVSGVIEVAMNIAPYMKRLTYYKNIIITTVIILIISLIIILLLLIKGLIIKPIKLLINMTRSISKGDIGYRVKLDTKDEFSALGESLNSMCDSLEKTKKEMVTEIEAHKLTEETLREKTEYLAEAQKIAHIGHWKLSLETNEVTGSHEFFNILGLSQDEATLASFVDVVHPEDRERDVAAITRGIEHGENWNIEHRLICKDGTEKFVHAVGKARTDDSGKTIQLVGTVQDITERKKLEAEKLKVQKLESVGILAGGIAHDFNNILTGVIGNISIAKATLGSDKAYERLTVAEDATARAVSLSTQLLTFSKGGEPIKKTAYLKDLIKDSFAFSLSGSNIKLECSIHEDIMAVDMDTDQISQVFHNLAINAKHAMLDGGLLKIEAENVKIHTDKEAKAVGLKKGWYIKISVNDNGVGIGQEHINKIFDPYFTTREDGNGLGLATSYSIIRKHDGHIRVESQLGVGTTFYIYLPTFNKPPVGIGSSDEVIIDFNKKKHKGMKVLVIDDEEIVRDVAGEMLNFLGYEVDFAMEVSEAVELYRKAKESGESFNVVIMDLTIPGGMGGREAIKKLLEVNPEVKVLVSSGYSNDPVLSNYKKYGFCGVITKPYKFVEFSKEVNRVVAGED